MVLHLFHVRFLTPGEPERAHVRNTSCGHAHASPSRGVFGPPVPTQTPSAQGGRGRRRSQPFAATWRAAAAAAPVVRGGGGAVRPSVRPSRAVTQRPQPDRPGVAVSRVGSGAQS